MNSSGVGFQHKFSTSLPPPCPNSDRLWPHQQLKVQQELKYTKSWATSWGIKCGPHPAYLMGKILNVWNAYINRHREKHLPLVDTRLLRAYRAPPVSLSLSLSPHTHLPVLQASVGTRQVSRSCSLLWPFLIMPFDQSSVTFPSLLLQVMLDMVRRGGGQLRTAAILGSMYLHLLLASACVSRHSDDSCN
jgi:hypothetical protein